MKLAIIMVILSAMLIGAVSAAEQVQSAKFSLQLDNTEIDQALTKLSQQANVTILGDSTVKGKVSCNLNDITIEQALDTICKLQNLEWLKTYTSVSAGEKVSPSKLFTLLDALKALGGSALICETPDAQTVFIPQTKTGSVDVAPVVSGLKLKPVYIVRVKPDPEALAKEKETKEKAEQQKQQQAANNSGLTAPPADVTTAANQVWDYFGNMSPEQRNQVMRELRNKFMESMTPEQRAAMQERFQRRRDRNGDN